ncbi:hypothetical protein BC332_31987 [Capsicum chinense]|nr:hypothetical protein BC332_31987 [Capsicum chinense]
MTINTAYSLNAILLDKREYLVAAIINSIAHSFDKIFRKRYAEVSNSTNTFILEVEKILRKNMTESDTLYMNNINGNTIEFTVIGCDPFANVNLLRKSCSCRKYDLVKLSYAHAMAAMRLKHRTIMGSMSQEFRLDFRYILDTYKLALVILLETHKDKRQSMTYEFNLPNVAVVPAEGQARGMTIL